jgi:fumarate hydratase class I
MEVIHQTTILDAAFQLLSNTANKYPKLYLKKLLAGLKGESNPSSKSVIISIIENIISAAEGSASLCQDTGVPTFHVFLNPELNVKGDIEAALIEGTQRATMEVPIRRNVVEPFTYENPGNNTGWGTPFIYYHYSSKPGPMKLRAELKGFGGEIKSTTDWVFTSAESMEDAVLVYVLHNVMLSRGEGCIPGFLGVGVGGYVSEAMVNAKNAVFRELSQEVPPAPKNADDRFIRNLEHRIFQCVNRLGLGPMGGGGNTTTLGVYLERRGTHTAVAPVSVSQQCWASRGSEAAIRGNQVTFLTPHFEKADIPALREEMERESSQPASEGSIYELSTPIDADKLLELRIGDVVYLNGTICTSRDGAHRRMVAKVREGNRADIPEEILTHGAIYHCGPVISEEKNGWSIVSAGPTTSSRFTDDAAFLMEQGIIKVAIGKGTMGAPVVNALTGKGVFLTAVGGCAVMYRKMIQSADVKWLDLGYPEAVWIFRVKQFGPLVVSIDAAGQSVSPNVMQTVYENAFKIYAEEGLDPKKRYIQYPQTFAGLSLKEITEI